MYKLEERDKLIDKVKAQTENWSPVVTDWVFSLKSGRTMLNNASILKHFFHWLILRKIVDSTTIYGIGEKQLYHIKPIHIEQYLQWLITDGNGKPNKLSSVSTKLEVLRSFFGYLAANDYISKNIVNSVNKKTYQEERTNTFYDRLRQSKTPTDSQLLQMLDNFEILPEFELRRNRAIVWTFCGSGIRLSELTGLDVGDVNFNEKSLTFMSKGNIHSKSKTGISDAALNMILAYLKEREKYAADSEALFIDYNGKRLTADTIYYIIKKYSNGEITPHMLRHWVGSKIFETTHNIKDAQEQLGHSSYEVTAQSYVYQGVQHGNNVINAVTDQLTQQR